jgi:hypothetical protein
MRRTLFPFLRLLRIFAAILCRISCSFVTPCGKPRLPYTVSTNTVTSKKSTRMRSATGCVRPVSAWPEIAYVGKTSDGKYSPFIFGTGMLQDDVEISEDLFLIRKETAEAYKAAQTTPTLVLLPGPPGGTSPVPSPNPIVPEPVPIKGEQTQPELFPHIQWSGEVPAQKWMNFYTKIVSKFAASQGVKLKVTFEASPEGGVSKQKLEETRAALRELGLNGDVQV